MSYSTRLAPPAADERGATGYIIWYVVAHSGLHVAWDPLFVVILASACVGNRSLQSRLCHHSRFIDTAGYLDVVPSFSYRVLLED